MKAQSSVEFVVLIGAVMFFFIGFLLVITTNIGDKTVEQRRNAVIDVAENVKKEIDIATGTTDGYSRTFVLPEDILGAEYEISLVSSSVYVRTIDGKHAVSLDVFNVTGDVQIGTNVIRKSNGVVYLNSQ